MACWTQSSFGCQGCLWFSWDIWLASGGSAALVSQGGRQPLSALPNTVLVIFSASALPCGRGGCAFLPAESASQGHCQGLRLTLPGGVRAVPTAQGPQPELEKQYVDAGIRGILEDLSCSFRAFPVVRRSPLLFNFYPWNPLAICLTAPLHSFLLCMWPDCDNSPE